MKKKIFIIVLAIIISSVSLYSVASGAGLNIQAVISSGDDDGGGGGGGGDDNKACTQAVGCNQDCSSCSCTDGLFCYESRSGSFCRNPIATSSPNCINDLIYINIHATPEKRKPYNNPDLSMTGQIILAPISGDKKITIDFETGPSGWTQAGVPGSEFSELPANFNIYFKGDSYLAKRIDNVNLVEKRNTDLDGINQLDTDLFPTYYFRDYYPGEPSCPFPGDPCLGEGNKLLAGDVGSGNDNYVNGLDMAAVTGRLYGQDKTADLDHNGIINGLDMTIAGNNLYKQGQ